MSPKEFYEWALERNAEDCSIRIACVDCLDHGRHNSRELDESDLETSRNENHVPLELLIIFNKNKTGRN